jgi:hypothetical protein
VGNGVTKLEDLPPLATARLLPRPQASTEWPTHASEMTLPAARRSSCDRGYTELDGSPVIRQDPTACWPPSSITPVKFAS